MKQLFKPTLTKNLTGFVALEGVSRTIDNSGASEEFKLAAQVGIAALMALLIVSAQYGPRPKGRGGA
jgi:hypothetical protein